MLSIALCAQCAGGTSVNDAAWAVDWDASSRVAESSRVGMYFFMGGAPFFYDYTTLEDRRL